MNTCSILAGRPSLGSWVTYGMGTENQNLPAYVVMQDNASQVVNGPRNWGAGFMPAVYQGVRFSEGSQPIPNLSTPEGITTRRQAAKLAFLNDLNAQQAHEHAEQSELEARIQSYELAFRMQAHAPEAVDLASEDQDTLNLYGMNQKDTAGFASCVCSRGDSLSAECALYSYTTVRVVSGMRIQALKRTTVHCAKRWTCRWRDCFETSSDAACWMIRSSSGRRIWTYTDERKG